MPSRLFLHISLILVAAIGACTPKTGTSLESPEKEPDVTIIDTTATEKTECITWTGKSFEDYALEQHVIYRDFLKRGNYKEAYDEWRIAFKLAPAADGERATHFEDGIILFDHFLQTESDSTEKSRWLDSVMVMYDRMGICYYDEAYISGRKAFDLYYKYRGLVTDRDILDKFEQAIDLPSRESKVFIMNPFTALLVEHALAGTIELSEAQNYAAKISRLLELKKDDCGKLCDEWNVVASYVPAQIERLESIRGMFDCNYYSEKYYPQFLADSSNCEVIEEVYIRMNWGGCDKSGPRMTRVAEAARKNCTSTTRNETLSMANEALQEGRYRDAISLIEKYINEETDDPDRKAKMKFRIANIYYGYLKNFPAARKAAQEASRFQPGWGDPYMLIGTLYASSGPLCGPGRGWDSQVVVWPAIDMWTKAKSIDRSVASKANELIDRYSQYMPTIGDVFQRGLQDGQSYFVPCWIQETTVIRALRQ